MSSGIERHLNEPAASRELCTQAPRPVLERRSRVRDAKELAHVEHVPIEPARRARPAAYWQVTESSVMYPGSSGPRMALEPTTGHPKNPWEMAQPWVEGANVTVTSVAEVVNVPIEKPSALVDVRDGVGAPLALKYTGPSVADGVVANVSPAAPICVLLEIDWTLKNDAEALG